MKPFCEAVVSHILPAVRAMVATKLVSDYGFTQAGAAKHMGISQPAVSQYKHSLRGARSGVLDKYPGISQLAADIAAKIASGRGGDSSPTLMFCELCRKVRLSGLGCEVHRELDGSLSDCNICMSHAWFYGGGQKPPPRQRAPVKPLTKFAGRQ